MKPLSFGNQNQVAFPGPEAFYYAMGFLANARNAELRWEHNEAQGAWGSEGRIHCLVPSGQFPPYFRFTAGRDGIYARINCNDYVELLVRKHGFRVGSGVQDVQAIQATVPREYLPYFNAGYNGQKMP